MKSKSEYPHIRALCLEGGPDDRRPIPSQGLSKQRVQKQGAATESGMIGLAHQHPWGA